MFARRLSRFLPVVVVLAASAAAAQQTHISVKGSDSVADRVGVDRVAAFEGAHPGVKVAWEALGSGTAFVGLLDGSADIGASARPILPEELAQASKLGIGLEEHVLGIDAIAVVVSPSSPLSELTREQLAQIFSGKIKGWKELGGPALPVQLASLPVYSGTQALFAQRVLGGDSGALFPEASTEFFEEPEQLLKRVASDRRYIGYVGLGFVDPKQVKIVALARDGEPAQQPTPAALRSGSYLLNRVLYLYTRAHPPQPVRELVAFLTGPGAKPRAGAASLLPVERAAASETPVSDEADAPAPTPPTRIQFRTGSTRLGDSDRAQLDALVKRLQDGSHTALILGHADGMAMTTKGHNYSLERAEVIADYLRKKGVPQERIAVEARGESQPIVPNQDPSRRQQNRRAEVYLIPLQGDVAAQVQPD